MEAVGGGLESGVGLEEFESVGSAARIDSSSVFLDAVKIKRKTNSGGDFVNRRVTRKSDEDVLGAVDFVDDFFDKIALSSETNSSIGGASGVVSWIRGRSSVFLVLHVCFKTLYLYCSTHWRKKQ